MYEDYGTLTCWRGGWKWLHIDSVCEFICLLKCFTGYPGILTHLTDSKTFAEWVGGDYVNLDGCYADHSEMDKSGIPNMSF
jgi:hypothetical protein